MIQDKTQIEKTFKTETAHVVRHAVSERCRYNVHGHSYLWEVVVQGAVNNITGMVLDFAELKPIKDFIDDFDHAMVLYKDEDPAILGFFCAEFQRVLVMQKNCTAENMARLVFRETQKFLDTLARSLRVVCVRVRETTTGAAVATSCDAEDRILYSSIKENTTTSAEALAWLQSSSRVKLESVKRINAQLGDVIESLLFLIEQADPTAWNNEVVYQGQDEGSVMASKYLERARKQYSELRNQIFQLEHKEAAEKAKKV